MKRGTAMMVVFSAIVLGVAIMVSYGEMDKTKGWSQTHELSRLQGAEVRNLKNERIGKIEDFVINTEGQVTLVIFSHDGVSGMGQKVKIIPYSLLSIEPGQKHFILDISREQLVSRPEVKNLQGEKLGEVDDFIIDSTGRVAFAILARDNKRTAVPFSVLRLTPDGSYFVMNISKEKLASAPDFKNGTELADRELAREIYRYYGQTPYWTTETGI